jgi:hypothetical protein
MATIAQAYQSIANINLWLKLQTGDQLVLTDIPSIIPLRWTYFSQQWNMILPNLQTQVSSYVFSDLFATQLIAFTNFVEVESTNTSIINPLSNAKTLYQFYTVFDNITLRSINLTVQEQTIVTNATTTVSQYTRNDFVALQTNIMTYRDSQADILGLTDPTYNATYNRNPVAAQTAAQVQDVEYLETLQTAIQTVDFILANLFAVDTAVDPFALARANANNPNVDIGQYSSGNLVRFQYGDDLESLAYRYLGDPDKWIDIAIANGLQPPYVDEVGQNVPLQANGNGNQINIAATGITGNDNTELFYINQVIYLQSTTLPFPNQRTITNLEVVPATGDLILTLNGSSNLSQYTTATNATVLVYAPDTINSHAFILIPSQDPLPNQRQETLPWFLASSPEDEIAMGIDLLLSPTDDLVFTPNHDLSLSYSLQNATQAMKLKIVTELGELRYHSDFGLVNIIGSKNNNISAVQTTITSALLSQVAQDARFDRVESLYVDYLAGANSASMVVIEMQVRLAGSNQVIPISFSVNYT